MKFWFGVEWIGRKWWTFRGNLEGIHVFEKLIWLASKRSDLEEWRNSRWHQNRWWIENSVKNANTLARIPAVCLEFREESSSRSTISIPWIGTWDFLPNFGSLMKFLSEKSRENDQIFADSSGSFSRMFLLSNRQYLDRLLPDMMSHVSGWKSRSWLRKYWRQWFWLT